MYIFVYILYLKIMSLFGILSPIESYKDVYISFNTRAESRAQKCKYLLTPVFLDVFFWPEGNKVN